MDNESKDTAACVIGMSCAEIELLVDDYIDGDLSELDSKRFERHVQNCAICQEIVTDCRRVVETAKLLADRPVPPAVSQRLRATLQEELGLRIAPARPRLSLVD